MTTYVIVAFLAKPHAQEFPRDEQPLHLTLLGTFYSHENSENLSRTIESALHGLAPLTVITGSREQYGRDNDVAVVTVKLTAALREIHKKLLNSLQPDISLKSSDYNNEGYHPHITDKSEQQIHPHTIFTLDTVSLIHLGESTGYVKKEFSLS